MEDCPPWQEHLGVIKKMGHGEIPKVPSPDIYKVEDIPRLMLVRKMLAERGLTSPWLRNDVWRYREVPVTRKQHIWWLCTRGLKVGIPLFILTIAIEKYYGIEPHHPNMHGRDYY
ncbi:NADH dehydrogenase [ubiquinone] 1 beta subcomplex subunit 3 [Halictus rubicundus]|uniref:NADH dehydrogenase [ubiquinone] 1 beta subcomplex subunit 3 n=1 Tax=Halictus rubicundus TaxID=77578 RepID=UPI0040356D05